MLAGVAALPPADVERVEVRVHGARPGVAVAEGALAAAQPLGGLVDITRPSSTTHDCSPLPIFWCVATGPRAPWAQEDAGPWAPRASSIGPRGPRVTKGARQAGGAGGL